MTVQAVEYDKDTNITGVETFDTVEAAMAWCEERGGDFFHWGDTNFGYSGMAEVDFQAMDENGNPTSTWYEIHGWKEDGMIRELEESDFAGGKFL
jgi:hypothetical protein